MNESLNKEIARLANIWYNYVSTDHHKDRDCHFYIETVWSYGEEPFYRAVHNGYIMEDWQSLKCNSYEIAQKVLHNKLLNEIESAMIDCKDIVNGLTEVMDDYDVETAKRQLEILSQYKIGDK